VLRADDQPTTPRSGRLVAGRDEDAPFG